MKKTYLCTGGLGFIGSHLVDALLDDPETKHVRIVDNRSSGNVGYDYLDEKYAIDERLCLTEFDLVNPIYNFQSHSRLFDVDCVVHLAANPDARRGIDNTRLDLELETILTYNVLETMRRNGVKKIIFASSGTVYGDCGETVCREGQGERLPISLYGAGKVASEALISAFCGTFGMKAVIFRFGNVIGERTTHGAIFDWLKQLREHPDHLTVLGDGNQSKPFVYVGEVVAGMLHGLKLLDRMKDGQCEAYNLAPDGATTVKFMACELVKHMRATKKMPAESRIEFGSTPQGWAGDVAHCRMDSIKLRNTGFAVTMPSDEAVKHGIRKILEMI